MGEENRVKVEKNQIFCVLLGITFAAAAFFVENMDSPLADGKSLERNSYGEGEKEQVVIVKGLLDDAVELDVQVREQQYDEAAARSAMDAAAGKIAGQIAGENSSLEEVRKPLNLSDTVEGFAVSVEWKSENPELIEKDGTVHSENCPETGEKAVLTAVLAAGDYREEYLFPLCIYPSELSEEEARLSEFRKFLGQMDEGQKTSKQFVLPEIFEGKNLVYGVKRDYSFLMFPGFGLLAAVLLPFRDKQKEKEERRKRERQMMIDYPEIVSKLVVFSGAGLPLRKAWERIVTDYEKNETTDRAAYEEMAGAYHMMQRGIPEIRAYAEFGSRCRCLPYRKLAGLLEQNLKNGSEGLRAVLEAEMENAFEQKKNLARRMGEEASTKLLVPLFLMLLIVMIMISVPAFLSFGIG